MSLAYSWPPGFEYFPNEAALSRRGHAKLPLLEGLADDGSEQRQLSLELV